MSCTKVDLQVRTSLIRSNIPPKMGPELRAITGPAVGAR